MEPVSSILIKSRGGIIYFFRGFMQRTSNLLIRWLWSLSGATALLIDTDIQYFNLKREQFEQTHNKEVTSNICRTWSNCNGVLCCECWRKFHPQFFVFLRVEIAKLHDAWNFCGVGCWNPSQRLDDGRQLNNFFVYPVMPDKLLVSDVLILFTYLLQFSQTEQRANL